MRPHLDVLPDETVQVILRELQRADLCSISLSCRRLRILAEPCLWRDLDLGSEGHAQWQESMTGTRIYPSTLLALRCKGAMSELITTYRLRQLMRTLDSRPELRGHVRSLRLSTNFLASGLGLRLLGIVKDSLNELELLPDVDPSVWRLHVTDHLLKERQSGHLRDATLESKIATMSPLFELRKVSFSVDTVRLRAVLQLLGRCPNVDSIRATHLATLSSIPQGGHEPLYPVMDNLRRLNFETTDWGLRGLLGHWVDTSPKLEKLVVGGIVQAVGRWKSTMRPQTCA